MTPAMSVTTAAHNMIRTVARATTTTEPPTTVKRSRIRESADEAVTKRRSASRTHGRRATGGTPGVVVSGDGAEAAGAGVRVVVVVIGAGIQAWRL
jgi:hypothetical protein